MWNGYLVFAMPWEEEPKNGSMGDYFYVPVTINFGGVDLVLVDQDGR